MTTNRFRRLLAATDLSAPARHAAERAALTARQLQAGLDLLHVTSLPTIDRFRQFVAELPAGALDRLMDDARADLEKLGEHLAQQHGVAPGLHLRSGPLLQEIIGAAATSGADLLVLGARGNSFMRHLLLGTTAERLIRKTDRPMLVVKQAPHEPYRTLLVPVDFSAYSLPALQHARAIAPDATIILLHAFELPFEGKLRLAGVEEDYIHRYRIAAKDEARERLRALRDAAGLPPECARLLVLHGNPSLAIIQQEQEQDCDLIVIGKHGESVIEDLLLGGVTKHVLAESQGDVLVSV